MTSTSAYVASASPLRLFARTLRASRQLHRRPQRRLTIQRIVRSVKPTLEQPVFIIGAPRSGTTLLGNCVARLPEFSYHFEPVMTKYAARQVVEGELTHTRARRLYRFVYRWLLRVQLDGDLRFCEKTPRNCFLVDFLSVTFPQACFLHIIRDGRDVAVSYSEKPWLKATSASLMRSEPGGYYYGPYPRFWVEADRRDAFMRTTDLHRSAWMWRRHVESARASGRSVPPGRYCEVRYEALVTERDREATRILDFLAIDSAESGRAFRSALTDAHDTSIGRWRSLSQQQIDTIDNEAGDLLARLNYVV